MERATAPSPTRRFDSFGLLLQAVEGAVLATLLGQTGIPTLRELSLYFCKRASGPIPASIGASARLRKLNLSTCRHAGPIPPEIGRCTELVLLNLTGANDPVPDIYHHES